MKGKGNIVVLWAVMLMVIRVFIMPQLKVSWTGTYEAIAHVFVGFLTAAWWYNRGMLQANKDAASAEPYVDLVSMQPFASLCGWLAIILTTWESLWFFTQKYWH
jgi:hypothetical protein